jgi:putative transposase
MATPRSTRDPLFLGRWFQDEVIIVAVRSYLTYPRSYRQVCDVLRDRGVSVAPSTVMRWGHPLCAGIREAVAAIREAGRSELAGQICYAST